jgi:hypothetical protein
MRMVPLLAILLVLPGVLPAAILYVETWDNQQANGWFIQGLANPAGSTVSFPGGVPTWKVNEQSGPFNRGLNVDGGSGASSGFLTGDYLATGATSVQFDFALDSDSLNASGAALTLQISGLGPGGNNSWKYTFTLPSIGSGMQTFSAPLSGVGWVQVLGTGTFQQAATTGKRPRCSLCPVKQHNGCVHGQWPGRQSRPGGRSRARHYLACRIGARTVASCNQPPPGWCSTESRNLGRSE